MSAVTLSPFVLSLSKHCSPHAPAHMWHGPFDRLRANGCGGSPPC